MSIDLMSLLWKTDHPPATKFVLITLADWANDDGGNIYPSMEHVAWKTGYSKRQVQRIIKTLANDDILIMVAPSTPLSPAQWRINLNKLTPRPPFHTRHKYRGDILSPHDNMSPGDKHDAIGVTFCHGRGDNMSPDPSSYPSIDPSSKSADLESSSLFGRDPAELIAAAVNDDNDDSIDPIIIFCFRYCKIDKPAWPSIIAANPDLKPQNILAIYEEFTVDATRKNIGTGVLVNRLRDTGHPIDATAANNAADWLVLNLPADLRVKYAEANALDLAWYELEEDTQDGS